MSNVVTMQGNILVRPVDLLEMLAERDDLAQLVIVVERQDGMTEIFYTRQAMSQLVFASVALDTVVKDMVPDFIAEED